MALGDGTPWATDTGYMPTLGHLLMTSDRIDLIEMLSAG